MANEMELKWKMRMSFVNCLFEKIKLLKVNDTNKHLNNKLMVQLI